MDTAANYHFKFGTLDCIALSDLVDVRPLSALLQDLAPDRGAPDAGASEDLARALQAYAGVSTEATTWYNCLFIRSAGQRILVDAGMGSLGRMVHGREGALLDLLAEEGIAPGDVDLIVITHGDYDHVGGLVGTDGSLVFSRAGYILPRHAWNFWTDAAALAGLPAPITFFARKTLPLIRGRVRVVEPGEEFLPGFRLIPAPGHRPAHTAVSICSAGERLLHLADTIGHPLLLEHPAWRWYADSDPVQTGLDRRRLLEPAASEGALVFGAHLPFPGLGRVTPQGDGWRWEGEENGRVGRWGSGGTGRRERKERRDGSGGESE